MNHLKYEILATPTGSASAQTVLDLLQKDPQLEATSSSWEQGDELPKASDLYVLVVVLTDDLAADPRVRARVAAIAEIGLPVLPVVPSVASYDFQRSPLPALTRNNAVGLDDTDSILTALLHHGGLRRFGSGGQIFVSYARKDGTALALALRERLERAGFRAFLDVREVPGGSRIQDVLEREMGRTDLVILIDSDGAAKSPWVGEEMDMARVAHVPVIAVTPSAGAVEYSFHCPHVPWNPGADLAQVADAVADRARRHLARTVSFHDRVGRVIAKLSEITGWDAIEQNDHWLVGPPHQRLHVESSSRSPTGEAVLALADRLNGNGLLVGGTRGYPRLTARVFESCGTSHVRVTPLPRLAAAFFRGIVARPLAGKRIFLSAASPDNPAAAAHTLAPFVITFVQAMVDLGATIVFGGHPSVTPLIHKAIVDIAAQDAGAVELFQALAWFRNSDAPSELKDRRVFRKVSWHPEPSSETVKDEYTREDIAAHLTAMRDAMITSDLDAAVFVGGRMTKGVGPSPGIVDEYKRFRRNCPDRPPFVLGLAHGAAAHLLENHEPPQSALDLRLTHELRETSDPDLATALIIAELLDPLAEPLISRNTTLTPCSP